MVSIRWPDSCRGSSARREQHLQLGRFFVVYQGKARLTATGAAGRAKRSPEPPAFNLESQNFYSFNNATDTQ